MKYDFKGYLLQPLIELINTNELPSFVNIIKNSLIIYYKKMVIIGICFCIIFFAAVSG